MTKKLERKSNKVLFGVAAGLADYFNFDVTILRLILVAMMFLDGSGVVIITYLIAAWLMPKQSSTPQAVDDMSDKEREAYAAGA